MRKLALQPLVVKMSISIFWNQYSKTSTKKHLNTAFKRKKRVFCVFSLLHTEKKLHEKKFFPVKKKSL